MKQKFGNELMNRGIVNNVEVIQNENEVLFDLAKIIEQTVRNCARRGNA